MLFSNRYINHRASNPYLFCIHNISASNIQKSNSIALPRWTLRFVTGLFLVDLGCATRKNKGRSNEDRSMTPLLFSRAPMTLGP